MRAPLYSNEIFKQFDDLIAKQKSEIKAIERKINLSSACFLLFCLGSVAFVQFGLGSLQQLCFVLQMMLVTTMLVYSVLRIRRAIKHVEHVFPNECFMVWHIWNFLLTMVLILVCRVTRVVAYRDLRDGVMDERSFRLAYSSIVIAMVEAVVTFYGVLFLLYVILKFSKSREGEQGEEEG